MSAAELSAQINESLAALKSKPPTAKIKAFIIGLFIVPTLGLSYLAAKILNVFGRIGHSPERVKLALDQNLRTAETSFKSDPDMKALIEKGRSELNAYIRMQHDSHGAIVWGLIVAIILIIATSLMIHYQAKVRMKQVALAQQQATLTQVQRIAEGVKAGNDKAVRDYADLLKQSLTFNSSAKVAGIKRIAVLVANSKQGDSVMTQALVKLLQNTHNEVTGGLFTESFVATGLFDRVFNSDLTTIKDLNLTKVSDVLLLVKEVVTFVPHPEYNVTNVNITLTFKFLAADSGAVLDSYSLESNNEAFTETKARSLIMDKFSEINLSSLSVNQ